MKNFKSLNVWQKSHQLTIDIYTITREFPSAELFGLVSQMRRCSVSIPSNISEGCGRNSDAELARFMVIASGSAAELEYQILLSRELNYISELQYQTLQNSLTQIRKMLNVFVQKLKVNS